MNRDLFTAWGFSAEDARKRAGAGKVGVYSSAVVGKNGATIAGLQHGAAKDPRSVVCHIKLEKRGGLPGVGNVAPGPTKAKAEL